MKTLNYLLSLGISFSLVLFSSTLSIAQKEVNQDNWESHSGRYSTSLLVAHSSNLNEVYDKNNSPNQACLSTGIIQSWGCDWVGADQATITVRRDGTGDVMVHYCCNKPTCFKTKAGFPTSPGNTQHAEWSLNGQCLELKVNQTY